MSVGLHEISPDIARGAAHDAEEFLSLLSGPVWIRIPGRDPGTPRMMTTLLHGNEPSGLLALTRLLEEGVVPAVDLLCAVLAVGAALESPRFSHRSAPGKRDMNRCFALPFDGYEGNVAASLLELVDRVAPAALVDLHNTSGASPAYGVCTRTDSSRMGLVSLWAGLCIQTDLRLGTLMEAVDPRLPTVTIECGGAGQVSSHHRASEGLQKYATVSRLPTEVELPVLLNPIRVELAPGATIAYGSAPDSAADVILPVDADTHNFTAIAPGQRIGWLGPGGLSALVIAQASTTLAVEDLFYVEAGELAAARWLTPLMVTTDPDVARQDCLFYVLAGNGDARSPRLR